MLMSPNLLGSCLRVFFAFGTSYNLQCQIDTKVM